MTIANWPQLDCETGDPDDARELSLSFLHWLQAEQGLPGLRLRGDVLTPLVRFAARATVISDDPHDRHPDADGRPHRS